MTEPGTLLIVDDSPINLDLLVRLLETEGHDIVAARNGQEALGLMASVKPDLVLMDIAMPVMDGLEACRRMKAELGSQCAPVIFVTARTSLADLAEGFRVGCVDYVRKPIERQELLLRVNTHLKLRRLQNRLRQHNALMSALLETVAEGTLTLDSNGRIISTNPAALQQLGFEADQLLGNSFGIVAPTIAGTSQLWQESQLAGIVRQGGEFFSDAHSLQRKDGSLIPVEITAAALHSQDGDGIGAILAFRDITERLESRQLLASLKSLDQLTGLVNWKTFSEQVTRSLIDCQSQQCNSALLLIDLDDFRDINDAYGHDVGDQLLIQVAERLRGAFPDDVAITRLGGDEFALLVDDSRPDSIAARHSEKLQELFKASFEISDNTIHLSASIGFVTSREVYQSAQDMIRAADLALYRAKEQGRNTARSFTLEMQRRVVERTRTTAQLRHALENGDFLPHFQPLINSADGDVIGAEALLRWRHGNSTISTQQMIEAAERSGLIDNIGELMLFQACAAAGRWQAAGHHAYISVNISPRQLHNPGLTDQIKNALQQAQLAPEQLVLELTESCLVEDPDRTLGLFRELRDFGIRMAIDDFGTGYSSLSHLNQLEVDILKIDHSFVKDLGQDAVNTRLVNTIITLAHSLGLNVVAEGVETAAQQTLLKEQGCDTLQGWLFGKASDEEHFLAFLNDNILPVVPT